MLRTLSVNLFKYYRTPLGVSSITKSFATKMGQDTLNETYAKNEAELLEQAKRIRKDSKQEGENYEEILNNLHNIMQESEQMKELFDKISAEYKELQTAVFLMPPTQALLQKLSIDEVINLAMKCFTGSLSTPRNRELCVYFLQVAKAKAISKREKLLVEFTQSYVAKMFASETGDSKNFSVANEAILSLITPENESDMPGVIYHSIAKEMYKMGLNSIGPKNKKAKNQLMRHAEELFKLAAEKEVSHSLFYLGDMYENGDSEQGTDIRQAVEFYKAAASLGNAKALFKISQMSKKGIIMKRSPYLEYLYMKRAAEAGMVEAQHNLGVMYQEGVVDKEDESIKVPDEVKALSWYLKAASQGYNESGVNAANILIRGTADGKISQNKLAASMCVEKIKKTGSKMSTASLEERIKQMSN